MSEHEELNLAQRQLARRISATLDRVAEQADPLWEARMAQTIALAKQRHKRATIRQWSSGLAIAASIAFVVALPNGWLLKTSGSSGQVVDAQMLDEMDWLMAMEEASRDH